MSRRSPAAELTLPAGAEPDPELEALPEPRRPGRRLTLVAMTLTAVAALAMALTLRGEASYALEKGPPVELDELTQFKPRPELANRWVHGEALLGTTGAIRYGRPLDGDTFRLAPVAGNNHVWVEVRVPEGMEGPRFVPPTSFVGRLIPFSRAGLRHDGLPEAVADAGSAQVPAGSWLLIDGESPSSTRWAFGLIALFVGFAGFNLWGLYRLLRPVRDG
jgi:hypothetical protein